MSRRTRLFPLVGAILIIAGLALLVAATAIRTSLGAPSLGASVPVTHAHVVALATVCSLT